MERKTTVLDSIKQLILLVFQFFLYITFGGQIWHFLSLSILPHIIKMKYNRNNTKVKIKHFKTVIFNPGPGDPSTLSVYGALSRSVAEGTQVKMYCCDQFEGLLDRGIVVI